jgi:hypothetical protein
MAWVRVGLGVMAVVEEELVFEGFTGRGFWFPTISAIWWAARAE